MLKSFPQPFFSGKARRNQWKSVILQQVNPISSSPIKEPVWNKISFMLIQSIKIPRRTVLDLKRRGGDEDQGETTPRVPVWQRNGLSRDTVSLAPQVLCALHYTTIWKAILSQCSIEMKIQSISVLCFSPPYSSGLTPIIDVNSAVLDASFCKGEGEIKPTTGQ